MKINKQLIKDGYISERKHPECDYYIYNYTAKTQYEQLWNEDTMNCRGLILDDKGNIIAKPFKKFFNIGEYSEQNDLGKIPNYTWFDIWDKMDGSLGILYRMPNGGFRIATRGSFSSDQAIEGTMMFNEMFKNPELKFTNNWTYLFEIIYPANRIVVDYKERHELVLLAGVNNINGEEMTYEMLLGFSDAFNIPITQYYGRVSYNRHAFLKIEGDIPEGNEGFVLKFDNGIRVKVKSDEYKRLHRILTQTSNKSVWELLRNHQDINELLDRVPDEFYQWTRNTVYNFNENYKSIEHSCQTIVNKCKFKDRKDVAEYFCSKENKIYRGILFLMYDNKDYEDVIWKMLRPEYSKPFAEEK